MTHDFACPGCGAPMPHAAALADHTRACDAYRTFMQTPQEASA